MDMNYSSQTALDMPPELSGQLPRRVELSDDGRVFQIGISIIIGLITIGSLWYCNSVLHQMQQRSALRQDGVGVQGKITQLHRVGRGPDVVHYTFAVNGRTFSGMSDVPPELMQTLEKSNFITVWYLPSNPDMNHPAIWEWSFLSEWPIIFMLSLAGYLFGSPGIRFFRDKQVLVYGNPAVGIVTNCRKTGRGQFTVEYEFRTTIGTSINGKCNYIQQEIGAKIWILYMQQNPKRTLIYPSSSYYVEQ